MTLARAFRVVKAGALTTVQDLGRPGFARFGVCPSGAMDATALHLGNLLVGNPPNTAGLEIALQGPTLWFASDSVVALTGCRFDADVDARSANFCAAMRVPAGATLRIGGSHEGLRCYLAIRGGIDVPPVLDSRSTLVASGFGGFEGRPLRTGDVVPLGRSGEGPLRRLRPDAIEPPCPDLNLHYIPGPQEAAFSEDAIERFRSDSFSVSAHSDRSGVRLEGEPLTHRAEADLLPEGVVTGAVQVPADGRPIILGVDRPATGGYVKIGTVICADIGRIAYLKPRDRVRFTQTTVEAARGLSRGAEARMLSAIEEF